jgi:hypothetical protein
MSELGAIAGAYSGPPATPRQLRLVRGRPLKKASLRGFATIKLPIGLTIRDCPVLIGRNGAWATLPGKPQIDAEGRHKKDVNGKAAYVAVLGWEDRALNDRFSAAVVSAVRRHYPADLEDS